MKRSFVLPVLLLVAISAADADVTIRYRTEMSTPIGFHLSNIETVYMKGNKGASSDLHEKTIIDFSRREVTEIDTQHRKYATVPAAEYGRRMSESMEAAVAPAPGMDEMLKSMKTTCETKTSSATEQIQGVTAEERVVTCTTTMSMPENVRSVMPSMGFKMVMHVWSASASERLRAPGLWQFSGYELWQQYVMNPMASSRQMPGDAMQPMLEAMGKDQSAILRFSAEMSMQMGGGDTPIMKMSREMTELSADLVDDSAFSVPAGFTAEPFDQLLKDIDASTKELLQANEADADAAQAGPPIPSNVKAFIPALVPLTETEPAPVKDSNGKTLTGMVEVLVTVGPKGNVDDAEVLYGPEDLRQTALDTIRKWTFQPVIRDGLPVTAYTQQDVTFFDFAQPLSTDALQPNAEQMASIGRLERLQKMFSRSPQQELADLEQDSGRGGRDRRVTRLAEMALKAAALGEDEKAKAWGTELLASAKNPKDWNYGNAIHAGHSALGLAALHSGDVETARQELLAAGKTPGSSALNSFGPNMLLASELLKKGERDTVLEYFELCRKFWKMGGAQLDSMSATVKQGGTPAFNLEMPQ